MDRTVAFYTLGCKLNFAETSTIARTFEAAGYRRMQWEEKADIYVINTCTVTDNADKRFRYLVHGILKRNPEAYIIAVGCYAQTNPDEISRTGGVDLVLGAKDKFKITEYLSSLEKAPATQVHSCDISEVDTYDGSYSLSERTRAFLKIQDGCDYRCTYCTIPLARGKSRSQPLESVIANAEKIVAAGTYEIVLTGVNTGDWGRGLDTGQKFFDLVKALDNVEGLRRVRISSIEPNLITDEILEYIASGDKFMPHFHIPLQSGCNDILRAMKRRYLTPLYRSRIEKIKELMPHACIGADVIVGFPGETEANFEETYRFISSLEVSYLHIFTYSERENTPAWSMAGSVPGKVRAKRSKVLHLLGGRKKAAFYRSQLGSVRPVLFESENKDGMISGFTDNYVKVRLPWEDGLANTIRNVRLDGADAEGEITCSLVK